GPFLDGLFLQSNFGIVTRLGVWLMPRPPAIRAFFFLFPDDEDFGEIIDLVRPLKLSNMVPSLIKVTSDLYGLGTVATYPFARTQGRVPLPDEVRRELQREYGLGAWGVLLRPGRSAAAVHRASEGALRPFRESSLCFARGGATESHSENSYRHV